MQPTGPIEGCLKLQTIYLAQFQDQLLRENIPCYILQSSILIHHKYTCMVHFGQWGDIPSPPNEYLPTVAELYWIYPQHLVSPHHVPFLFNPLDIFQSSFKKDPLLNQLYHLHWTSEHDSQHYQKQSMLTSKCLLWALSHKAAENPPSRHISTASQPMQ